MSLQRCEGKNLESVLEEVRSRFGDTVTIVEANRLRKGGVGGFFTKERFEVVVDVDDEDGQSDLPAEFGMEATEDFCERLLTMADRVNDEPPAAVSTEQASFSAVLNSITRHMETEPAVPPAAPAAQTDTAVDPPAPATTPLDDGPLAPAGLAGSRLLLRPPAATIPAASIPAASIPAASIPAASIPAASIPAASIPAASIAAAGPAVRPPVPELKPGVDSRALARIGLPEDLRRAALSNPAPADGTDPSTWLVGLLSNLPQPEPLPRGQGAVIVVAGARDAALELARSMADELGLDEESLLIASSGYSGRARAIPGHRRLRDADAASEARRSWRRRSRPTVVAVEAPTGRPGQWARRVIDALEPTMVWAAVEATRKPEDLFEWSEQLGGFDALAVTDTEDTVSPAAVLQCGIPVGRLEGRAATPVEWASLLAPRLVG